MENKFAVIGLGLFGMRIARTLAQKGAEVLAVDNEPEKVELISDEVAYAIALDATDIRALQAHNVQDMDAVIVAIGEDFEAVLLCTVLLMELKVKRIITRSSSETQHMILEKMGVKEILSPENEVGMAVANRLLNPDIVTFIPLPDDHEIVEILAPSGIKNKTVGEIKLRQSFNLNLITIKREYEELEGSEMKRNFHIAGVPKADTVIFENDILLIMGKRKDIKRFIEINK
jgi:trk system potassium uptake protein